MTIAVPMVAKMVVEDHSNNQMMVTVVVAPMTMVMDQVPPTFSISQIQTVTGQATKRKRYWGQIRT